jgi:cell division protein FtsQ
VVGKRRSRAAARAQVLPFPERQRRQPPLAAWLPSARSILIGLALLAIGAVVYVAARQSSLFAVRTIEVEGAPAPLADRVRFALAPLLGTSLLGFGRDEGDRRLAGIAEIASAHYDRDFPHTLRVFVRVERPVAILRQGSDAWLVSASVRVLKSLPSRPYPPLPRIWIPRFVEATIGSTLAGPPAQAVRAVTPLERAPLPVTVRSVRAAEGELTLILGAGREVRLGDSGDLALKLAVTRRLLPRAEGALYLDVSVPERPVAGYDVPSPNPQVEG